MPTVIHHRAASQVHVTTGSDTTLFGRGRAPRISAGSHSHVALLNTLLAFPSEGSSNYASLMSLRRRLVTLATFAPTLCNDKDLSFTRQKRYAIVAYFRASNF